MSPSRDNLPAVEETLPVVLEERTRKTLSDVRILLGAVGFIVVTVFGGGWAALAQVREEAHEAARAEVAGLRTEQESLKASVSALRDDVKDGRAETADVKDEVRGMRQDLRTFAAGRPLPALPKDGGP